MQIETVYRLTVYYDMKKDSSKFSVDALERISTKLGVMASNNSVDEIENNSGGACWSPYLIVESDSIRKLEVYKGKVTRYLSRFKDIEFY